MCVCMHSGELEIGSGKKIVDPSLGLGSDGSAVKVGVPIRRIEGRSLDRLRASLEA